MGKDKTQTTEVALDDRSQGYVNQTRSAAGDLNRVALGSDPWAQGTGQDFQTGRGYLDQMGQGIQQGQGFGEGIMQGAMQGHGGAMAQGLGGLGDYASPYAQQMIQSGLPGYMQNFQMADMQGGQQAMRSGAYGGAREAILRAEKTGQVDRGWQQFVNQAAGQGTQMGMNAMMQDRQRMMGMAGMGLNQFNQGNQQFGNLAGQYGAFDQMQRGADRGLAMDEFNRGQAGLGARNAGLGPTGSMTTNTQQGSVLGDIGGLAMMGAGAFMGNPGMVGAGGSQLAGGQPGFGSPSVQGSPIMQQGAGLFNYGGYGGGLGGLGGQYTTSQGMGMGTGVNQYANTQGSLFGGIPNQGFMGYGG